MATPKGRRPIVGYCENCERDVWTHVDSDETPPVPVRCGQCSGITKGGEPSERQKSGVASPK